MPSSTSRASNVVDRVVAPLDLLGRRQLVDPGDQHVLVVGAVEDADVARLRERLLIRQRKSCGAPPRSAP